MQPHVAFTISADTRYDHAVKVTINGFAATGAATYNLICDGAHASSNECTGGAQGVYSTFTKNGSNQWVLSGTDYYSTVASPVLWFGGLANNQSYTLTFTQNNVTTPAINFTVKSGIGGPTNITMTEQAIPSASVPTICVDSCESGTRSVSNAYAPGSEVKISWTKPATGPIEANQGLYANSPLTPEGYIVTVLPSRLKPTLYSDNAAQGTSPYTAANAYITLSNGSLLYDGCSSSDTSRNNNFGTYGLSTTSGLGAMSTGWFVSGYDTTSVVLKGCHFARDESYVAYVEPFYTSGLGGIWKALNANDVPYGWDVVNGVFPVFEVVSGNSGSMGGGGITTLLNGGQPWQTGASAAMAADDETGNLVAMAAPVSDIVAQPASTTDPSLKGALRVSWSANTSETFYGTPNPSASISPVLRYRVTANRNNSNSWEATADLFHLNSTPSKVTCVTTGTTCVLTGMSEWTYYQITVQAENVGSRSTAVAYAYPKTNWPLSPTEPLNPVATSTDGSTSTISWDPPASSGGPAGATITKYTAYMYPQMSTVANDCGPVIPAAENYANVQLFQLQTTTKEMVATLFFSNGNTSGSRPTMSYYGRNANGAIACLGSVQFYNMSAGWGFTAFHPTPGGYIAMMGSSAYWIPKIEDNDPRLANNYGGQVQSNLNYNGLNFTMPELLYPGGPDFTNTVFLGNSSSTEWATTGATLNDVRQISTDGTKFLALVGKSGTYDVTTSKFYVITRSGATVTRATSPVISLGCRIIPSDFCSSTLKLPTPVTNIPTIGSFDINPVSKNIYFVDPTPGLSGTYTSSYLVARMFRMSYNSGTQTWGAPVAVTFDNAKTPQLYGTGRFPVQFDDAGRLFSNNNLAGTSFWPSAVYTESANGFTMVPGTNLLGWSFYRSPAFPATNWSRVNPMLIRTTFGHAFALDPYTKSDNTTLVRIAYTGDVNLHVCTSTDGPPATPSCTVGTGADPNPIVPGTMYKFDVTATNTSPDGSVKNGPLSTLGSFYAGGPAAPTLTALQLGGTTASPTATATFRPSVVSPGVVDTSITTYTCKLYSSTGSVLATKTVTPPSPITLTTDLTCAFTAADGVANNGSYQVGITATNSVGTSGPATAPLLVVAAPVAPSPVRGSTSGDVTTVSFTPNSTGTHSVLIIDPVTNAEVPGAVCTGATINNSVCTVQGLTPGKTYTLKACTTNPFAASPACTTTSYTVPVLPPSPPVVTTSPNDGTIDVAWPTPPNNGSVITGYTVTVSPGGGSGCANLTAASRSCQLTGLTNGTNYVIEVAVNYTLNGVAGTTKVATTVTDVPFVAPAVAPAPSAVSNASGAATVTYNPSADNGVTVNSYTFYAYDTNGNRVSPTLSCTAIAPATSCDIVGLTDGVTYTFGVVKNYQSPGGGFTSSTMSPLSNEVTPHGPIFVPDPPQNVTVDPADHAATVSWAAPANDGGAPITSYTVQAYDESGNLIPGATCTVNAPGLSCTVEGLPLGANYSFKVVATNAAGDSDPSVASDLMTPTGVDPTAPGPILNGAATGGNASITVTWDAPDTGDVPTSYEVSIPGQQTCVVDLVANPSAALSCTFTGLTNGTSYTATIVAKNAKGSSTSVDVSATPFTTPDSVVNGAANGGDASVTVTWAAPTSDGGAPVTSYEVTIPGQPTCVVDLVANPSAALSCTFTGLTNGTSYTATIVAKNSAGIGSSASVSATPYGTPTTPSVSTVTVASSGTGAVVVFTHPADTSGAVVTGYTVNAYDANGNVAGSCTTTATSCTIEGLTKGSTYTFKVQANTSRGNSALSSPTSLLVPNGYQKVNAYIRGWSYAQRDITDGMRKAIGAAARAIVAGNNTSVTVTGFANFTAKISLSHDRAVNVAAYLRHELNRFGGRSITIKIVTGGNTTKFGGTVLNRVVVLQGR